MNVSDALQASLITVAHIGAAMAFTSVVMTQSANCLQHLAFGGISVKPESERNALRREIAKCAHPFASCRCFCRALPPMLAISRRRSSLSALLRSLPSVTAAAFFFATIHASACFCETQG
ncbi:MAG TPA: hypothetical protein VNH83_11900, partial [Bryobacteraceae bacterium]|nr:hypothetical protein [Bryobacteraceae bacterium]